MTKKTMMEVLYENLKGNLYVWQRCMQGRWGTGGIFWALLLKKNCWNYKALKGFWTVIAQ